MTQAHPVLPSRKPAPAWLVPILLEVCIEVPHADAAVPKDARVCALELANAHGLGWVVSLGGVPLPVRVVSNEIPAILHTIS